MVIAAFVLAIVLCAYAVWVTVCRLVCHEDDPDVERLYGPRQYGEGMWYWPGEEPSRGEPDWLDRE